MTAAWKRVHEIAEALRTPLAGEIWLVLLMFMVVVWTFVK